MTVSFAESNNFASKTPISGANGAISLNQKTISANYSFPTGFNGYSAGPVTIADGVTVTVTSGSDWTIV